MSHRIAKLAALSLPLLFAQGAFAAQDSGFGYDTYYQFGYSRPVAGTATNATGSQAIGFEVDYVFGSDARTAKPSVLSTLEQRDILGTQAGA